MQGRLRLEHLPLDVLCEVAHWLNARDLIRLSLVNASLHQRILNDRSIWHDQIQQMVRNRCLPPNTFKPLGLPPDSLQMIATRPYRLLRAIETKRAQDGLLLPDLALLSSSISYFHGAPSYSRIFFSTVLPGSKWLLAGVGNDAPSILCCWDLECVSKRPETYALRKPLAIFEEMDDLPVIVAQYSETGPSVTVMALTCDGDGQYDFEILRLAWALPTNEDEMGAFFIPLARLVPGNIFVQFAFLDGDYIFAGCRNLWIVWNWRRDEMLNVNLEFDDVVHAVFLPPYLITLSSVGESCVYWIPPTSTTGSNSPALSVKSLSKSSPYGRVRSVVTLQSWIPPDLRRSTKICLKTTVSEETPQRIVRVESRFASSTRFWSAHLTHTIQWLRKDVIQSFCFRALCIVPEAPLTGIRHTLFRTACLWNVV
ncbi:uncharacterized protein EI90DRAFT_2642362 [Cantharellus anzutake]|uniref:uncharacterized protein n=1 Tax=Cantharellus anzutake TaxID=1750568 RepID=UPI0019045452|nr:uncharacterized protein EI90DRAFT_2642362 [Cantharellus anzutake]KAF8337369.1 hypothetical protein EI90DRAFT_2642362 [Cantharellus anzutake]